MKTSTLCAKIALSVATALSLAAAAPASAVALLTNGNFEAGLNAWTVTEQAGSLGSWFSQSGDFSPLSGFRVPRPPEGNFAAMAAQNNPGSYLLTQDFLVPDRIAGVASVGFLLFIQNLAGSFVIPDTLDYTAGPNQQFRADIMTTGADIFSVAPADVLQTLYQTDVGDPTFRPYSPVFVNVTDLFRDHPGQTLRLRFAETSNLFFFQTGLDVVNIAVAIPEPATPFLLLAGLAGLAAMRRRA